MMTRRKLISFDLRADFASFKKPDYNDGLQLTYNLLHKPALLGILGAIIGLEGHQKKGELPEYYRKLKELPVGIQPLGHEKGNFRKISLRYTNTVGYANKDGGTLLVDETMLLNPAYRCYLLLDLALEEHSGLYENLRRGYSEYIPYLGKNEFQASWIDKNGENTFREYEFSEDPAPNNKKYKISSIFRKTVILREDAPSGEDCSSLDLDLRADTFLYFERIPTGFTADPAMIQYTLESYTYSNLLLKPNANLSNLYFLKEPQVYVQLN